MRYQLESVLAQVRHLKLAQVIVNESAEEWVFPLEKELVRALEYLKAKELQKAIQTVKVQDSELLTRLEKE